MREGLRRARTGRGDSAERLSRESPERRLPSLLCRRLPVGRALRQSQSTCGLETRDTAGLEACATSRFTRDFLDLIRLTFQQRQLLLQALDLPPHRLIEKTAESASSAGAARSRDCGHEKLLGFTCESRHFCPACHRRRVRQTGGWIAASVCHNVPHRQFAFIFPKILRGECDRRTRRGKGRAASRRIHRMQTAQKRPAQVTPRTPAASRGRLQGRASRGGCRFPPRAGRRAGASAPFPCRAKALARRRQSAAINSCRPTFSDKGSASRAKASAPGQSFRSSASAARLPV